MLTSSLCIIGFTNETHDYSNFSSSNLKCNFNSASYSIIPSNWVQNEYRRRPVVKQKSRPYVDSSKKLS